MAYILPQELTVKEYATARRVSTRTVYEWLTKKPEKLKAAKNEGGWRIPAPVFVPDSPFIGQLVSFGDGSVCEIVSISDSRITCRKL